MFSFELYIRMPHFFENFGNDQILKNALTIVMAFFLNYLSNSFDFEETAVMRVIGVSKFGYVLKIVVAPLLVILGPISARNFYITREGGGVVRHWGRFYPVSRPIYIRMLRFRENFGKVKMLKNALTIGNTIFWVNLSNSFDFEDTAVIEVFMVAEFESVLKIVVVPFLVPLGPIFARNFGITREWRVARARGRLHRISSRISHKVAALF